MSINRITREEAADLFVANIGLIRTVAFRTAPSRFLMEDIVHNAFVTFVENVDKWSYDPKTIKQLLRSITEKMAAREWATYLKHLPKRVQSLANEIQRLGNQEESFQSAWDNLEEKTEALQICLDKLTPVHRTLIEEFYLNGTTGEELSLSMKKSRKAIYNLIGRVRIILHDCVIKHLIEE